MPSLHVVERAAYPQSVVGRSYQHFLSEEPAPLAGAKSPKRAGPFLKVANKQTPHSTDTELGNAIFRFVFLRY